MYQTNLHSLKKFKIIIDLVIQISKNVYHGFPKCDNYLEPDVTLSNCWQ